MITFAVQMAKEKTAYVCDNCGQESVKWMGKCPSCGQWNTFKEVRIGAESPVTSARKAASSVANSSSRASKAARAVSLRDISTKAEPRIDTHDTELNRVLGGGIVPGSIILLGGDPGIGKSTLTLQTIIQMKERRVLYVSGEESAHQIKMRAERLSPDSEDHVMILCETSLESIFKEIEEVAPELIVIDSIQTMETEDVESAPGSVTQIRECASALLRFAKTSAIPVILIGHINKEGTIAGPKVLEQDRKSVV